MLHEFLRPEDLFVGELQIPFLDRSRHWSTLTDWARSDPAPAVLWLFGVQGSGKTRLAIEITRALVASGWESRWLATPREPVAQLDLPTSLVINVALGDNGADAILELMTSVADRFRTVPNSRTTLIVRRADRSVDGSGSNPSDLRRSETQLVAFSIEELKRIGTMSAGLNDAQSQILAESLNGLGDDATPFAACACADTIKAGSFVQPPTFDQCIVHLIEGHLLHNLRNYIGSGPVPIGVAREIVLGAIFGLDASASGAAATALKLLNSRLPPNPGTSRHLWVPSVFWLVHYLVTELDAVTDRSGRDESESFASAQILEAVIEQASRSSVDANLLCMFLLRYISELKGRGLWSPLGQLQWSLQGRLLHDLLPVVGSYIFAVATKQNVGAIRTIVHRVLQSLDAFGSDESSYSHYLILAVNVATAVSLGSLDLDDPTKLELLTIVSRQLKYVEKDSATASYIDTVNRQLQVSVFALPDMIAILNRLVDYAESTNNATSFTWAAPQLGHAFNSVSKVLYVSDVASDRSLIAGALGCERLLARLATPANAASPHHQKIVTHFLLSLWRLLGIASTCVPTKEVTESFRAIEERLDAWQGLIAGTQEGVEIGGFRARIAGTGGFATQVLAGLSSDFPDLWRTATVSGADEMQRDRSKSLLNVMTRLVAEARARGSRNYGVRLATKDVVRFMRSGAVARDLSEGLLRDLNIRNA